MANQNLFAYGTLRDPNIFKNVCGLSFTFEKSAVTDKTLLAKNAQLKGYTAISPDNLYPYAIPSPKDRLNGIVILGMDDKTMKLLDEYEGSEYKHENICAIAEKQSIHAIIYSANPAQMTKLFGTNWLNCKPLE